jgi:PHD/YefM family antitoxin component YafN of YafNO toxin-antitoxin module
MFFLLINCFDINSSDYFPFISHFKFSLILIYVSLYEKLSQMETIIRIKTNELTPDFLNKIKALFKNEETLEISISPVSDFGLTKKESKKSYKERVIKAIKNLESKKNIVTFSENEFERLSKDLLNE